MMIATAIGWGTMAILVAAADIVDAVFTGEGGGGSIYVLIFSVPIWMAGGLLVGLPVWLVAHHLGHRSRRAAMFAGGVAVGIGHPLFWVVLIPGAVANLSGFVILVVFALAGAVSGATSGYTFHRFFYRSV